MIPGLRSGKPLPPSGPGHESEPHNCWGADLLLHAGVEVHRRTSDPREGAHGEQCGTACHRSLNDHPGRPFRLGDVEYPPEGQG